MADRDESKAQTLGKRKQMETEADTREEVEIEKLKSELYEMAQKIIDYRKTVPDLLAKALKSNLAAQRPVDPSSLEVAASIEINKTEEGLFSEDEGIKEKLCVLREKSERNLAAIPNQLKRLKECVEKITEIEQFSVNVHPIFKIKL
ncbi:hypothetical protein LUZ61_010466 [Rhynchospora tenuis]|uniref:Uncharacterized protein n=1 Tax=Rhynchospora tenuis TaxID=198213 RepID=A0AAD5ZZ51_9POAL|nr:hypothetical protein LUZ61_010466 [Rhynchospora tenuis]